MIPAPANPVVVALDASDQAEVERLAELLAPEVGMLKVGLEAVWAQGPDVVRAVTAYAPVFADAKLHDIPTTVERASASIAHLGVRMFNVHALGGTSMMRAARAGALRGADEAGVATPLVIAVTVLSSQTGEDLASPASLAWEAKEAGLDGVVVAGEDVRDVRDACGEAFCVVVPGIRPRGTNGDDQVRVLTPEDAIDHGADYLVIGRPITGSADPAAAARAVVRAVR